MEPTDLTIEILKNIRDEARKTNERLEALERGQGEVRDELRGIKEGQVETNARLEAVEHRLTDTEVRLATAITAVVGSLGEVKTLLQENYASTIRSLDRRVTALEARATD